MILERNDLKPKIKLSEQEKKQKLIALMYSVIDSECYRKEFEEILLRFSISRDDIVCEFLNYNMDVYSHDNDVYKSQAIRVVLHIHNLIVGSWHIERQEAVCRLIRKANPSKAIDLGFGVPARYVREMLGQGSYQLTLCDYDQSAGDFAEELFNIWGYKWRNNIEFFCANMENVKACVGDYDLYISLHSIEHVNDPSTCLRNYVELSSPKSQFLIEIPIGPITPEHNMAWADINEAKLWLKSMGLRILDTHTTYVNPAVDIFAEPHNFNYGGFLALCAKDGD